MRSLICAFIAVIVPSVSHAYVGPGVGLGTIVVTLAILLALFLLIVGFFWYPLKRLLRGDKAANKDAPPRTED